MADSVVTIEVTGTEPFVITLGGEFDAHSAGTLETEFNRLTEAGMDVTLDLSGVTFLDSTGLRTLLRLDEELREQGGSVRIRKTSPPVRRVLAIADLTGRFGLEA